MYDFGYKPSNDLARIISEKISGDPILGAAIQTFANKIIVKSFEKLAVLDSEEAVTLMPNDVDVTLLLSTISKQEEILLRNNVENMVRKRVSSYIERVITTLRELKEDDGESEIDTTSMLFPEKEK